jgi:hypothetical protein
MSLQDLRNYLDRYESQLDSTNTEQFKLLRGLPFYSDWRQDTDLSKDLDFNHAIGLPQKNGRTFPLFDYERLLYDTLQQHKHVWIKKSTGLGVTEFMLRYMAWLCLSRENLEGSQMCIVTGPKIELAITLIDRMKALFAESQFSPNAPEGLFERIEKEPESTCLYHRLFLDYGYGLGRIYTEEEIQAAKQSPSFEREYNLKYLGLIGNVFHVKDIETAIKATFYGINIC